MRRALGRRGSVVAVFVAAAVVGFMGNGRLMGSPSEKGITLTPIGVYRSNIFNQGGSEIAAYDPASRRLFAVNLLNKRIDVLDISNPALPMLTLTIPVDTWGTANSVAVHHGVLAAAIEAPTKTDPGTVVFFNAYGGFLSAVTVGALPDMLTFTPDGKLVLVANEGEPISYLAGVDPEGSVSIIDLSDGVENLTADDVTTAGFGAFPLAGLDSSIRIFGPGATVAQDLEPEYIAVAKDSKTAWVTLQENNALGIIDLTEKRVTRLVGLGFKNHNVAGAGLDTSDRDDHAVAIQPRPVLGMYQPDGIDTFEHHGRTYLVTANEGDVRAWPGIPTGTEQRRVSSGAIVLDPDVFPADLMLKDNAVMGRLNVTFYNGKNGDADFEQLYSFGARSFSVWDDTGVLVFDSGDAIEQITAVKFPAGFNANHDNNQNLDDDPDEWTHDSRSDDKGPEPENVTVAKLWGRQYAFIALERIGGVMVYELGDPAAPTFVDYVNVRKLDEAANSSEAEDLGPEGLIVIEAKDSPTGKPLLVVANEVSGTTRIFEIGKAKDKKK